MVNSHQSVECSTGIRYASTLVNSLPGHAFFHCLVSFFSLCQVNLTIFVHVLGLLQNSTQPLHT